MKWGCVLMDVSRATIQTSTPNPISCITHIQHAHIIREAYKSKFSEDSSEKFIIATHIIKKL
jgi:hypothetical protein